MSDRGTWKIEIGEDTFADYSSVITPVDSDAMPIIQKDNILGAAVSRNRQKGNLEAVYVFNFLIEQTGNGEAQDFWMTAPRTYNGVRTVTLTHKDYAGAELSWTLTDTEVHVKPAVTTGPSNTGTITFTGGTLS